MREYSLDDLRVALKYLNEDDRDQWIEAMLAIKASFGEDGFGVWDDWSSGSGSYNEKTARMCWRSAKPKSKLTVGTVFKKARDRGWEPEKPQTETDDQRRAREDRRRARELQLAAEAAAAEQYQELNAMHALEIVKHLHKTGASKYLGEKKIQAHGLLFAQESMLSVIRKDEMSARLITDRAEITAFLSEANEIPYELRPYSFRHLKRGCFAVPMRDIENKLWSLQVIWPTGKKSFFLNARKSGCFHVIGDLNGDAPIVFAEGYATGASIYMAMQNRMPVVCAFDAGNLMAVAQAFRSRYPDRDMLFGADNDAETEGNPGVSAATEAARAVGGRICIPDFSAVQARAA